MCSDTDSDSDTVSDVSFTLDKKFDLHQICSMRCASAQIRRLPLLQWLQIRRLPDLPCLQTKRQTRFFVQCQCVVIVYITNKQTFWCSKVELQLL